MAPIMTKPWFLSKKLTLGVKFPEINCAASYTYMIGIPHP